MEGTKTIVAYFSYSGTAKRMAEHVAAIAGADLFEIVTKKTYTSDYMAVVEEAKEELKQNARPELESRVENIGQYQNIILGFPNWCSTCPMPILSFLEGYDFAGKTIYSFVTNGGGGCGRSTEDIKSSSQGAIVKDSIDGNQLTDEQIKEWLGID